MTSIFVSIEGSPGVGKSSLGLKLSKAIGYEFLEEPVVENPYLDLFYKDMNRYGFSMQIHLLFQRLQMHRRALNSYDGVIQDRSILCDTLFAKNLYESGIMSENEWNTYNLVFKAIKDDIRYPHLVIFLDVSNTKILKNRISKRNRECELDIKEEYLEGLIKQHRQLAINLMSETNVVTFNWDDPNEYFDQVIETIRYIEKNTPMTNRMRHYNFRQ